jgi:2-oxoisovalerate dehydrogenase E1 component subunit alpha
MADRISLSLQIPTPKFRPGDAPDFRHLAIPPAGLTPRPPVDAPAAETRPLAEGLIRVLNDEGVAVGPWAGGLDPALLLRAQRAMLRTRAYDERMFRAQRQGKTSFYIKSTGEEAVAVGTALALASDDMAFATYRQQGFLIARDYPLLTMANQNFSNALDPLKGRQMPVLYSAREHGFFSLSGNLGTQLIQAVGWAMASAYKRDHRIAIGFTGEGATAEGDFHHALTFATVYRAPAIIAVVNNQWAISASQEIAGGEAATFATRAIGYGMPGLRVDGNDLPAVIAATGWAAERARRNCGPTLIEFFTYRAAAHSTSDDPSRYRAAGEAASWPLGDPIVRLARHLRESAVLDEAGLAALEAEAEADAKEAVRTAEATGTLGKNPPPLASMFEDVFAEQPWHLAEQSREAGN